MNKKFRKKLLTTTFILTVAIFTSSAYADTQKLIIESGDSAQSRQRAQMEKDQWKDTRTLRQKQNARAEKEWDKKDAAIDDSYACQTSENLHVYWEPNTRRCLDRRTGRPVVP
ncbi:MAG TPA: DUF1283 family protein [Candidatus Ignatzschineria merdigallinarum]|uniref:DUF1283 family protein n=1 Tax=Candidatus Ignatzschineria merdigallinarum TaxID=2838621 RepID=A0A9D1Q6R9_9GAMM|nr:DUF1283 family protein [Candidatus Ignatzschineria merdigallinarum]